MQSHPNLPIRSKMQTHLQTRGMIKSHVGRNTIAWCDKQRKAQAERKELAAQAKPQSVMFDQTDDLLRDAIQMICQHERLSKHVIVDSVRSFVHESSLPIPSRFDRPMIGLLAISDRVWVDPLDQVLIFVCKPGDSLLSLLNNTLSVRPIKIPFEEGIVPDPEDDRYVLVDPNPEATRQYYANDPEVRFIGRHLHRFDTKVFEESFMYNEHYHEPQPDGSIALRMRRVRS